METRKASRERQGARVTMAGPEIQKAMADLPWPSSSWPRTHSPPPKKYWGSPQCLGGALEERVLVGAWKERALVGSREERALVGARKERALGGSREERALEKRALVGTREGRALVGAREE